MIKYMTEEKLNDLYTRRNKLLEELTRNSHFGAGRRVREFPYVRYTRFQQAL